MASALNKGFPKWTNCSKIDHILTPRSRATANATVIVTQELVDIIQQVTDDKPIYVKRIGDAWIYGPLYEYIERTSDHLPVMVDVLLEKKEQRKPEQPENEELYGEQDAEEDWSESSCSEEGTEARFSKSTRGSKDEE